MILYLLTILWNLSGGRKSASNRGQELLRLLGEGQSLIPNGLFLFLLSFSSSKIHCGSVVGRYSRRGCTSHRYI